MFRSTKGASKHRRDLINGEIGNLRDLLPLPESARQRLSQLQIMSLACCFIRKNNYFSRIFGNPSYITDAPFEFSQSMTGFLMICTRQGKLLYISENVTEYLGHSMVDMMTQGDSIYDIIDKRDHGPVQNQLQNGGNQNGGADERTFFCRMNVSRSFRRQAGFGDHKVMHVKGHFVQPMIRDHYGNEMVFMAICSPLVTPDVKETAAQNNTLMFQSVHGLDMKVMEIAPNGEFHLGYTEQEMFGKSWYDLLHPDDLMEAKEKHMQLIKSSHEMGCMLTVRLQSKSGEWIWVNMVMHIRQPFVCDNGDPAIVCINHVICEADAQHFKMQSQLYSSHIARSPEFLSSPQGSSPPHTITQVPMEREHQIHMSLLGIGPSTSQDDSSYYRADFGVAVTTAAMGSSGGQGDMGSSDAPHLAALHKSSTMGGSFSDSGSGSEYSSGSSTPTQPLSTQDQKQLIRADIINRLKRKMTAAQEQCQPPKIPRYQPGSNGEQGHGNVGYSVRGTAVVTGRMFIEDLGMQSQPGSGQVLVQSTANGPILQQLSLKKEMDLMAPNLNVKARMTPSPLTDCQPLTPESVTSETAESTLLSIDISERHFIPPSLLTPDSTPSSSPTSTTAPLSAEQCVPTMLADLEDTSVFSEMETDTLLWTETAKPCMKVQEPQKKNSRLPVLDALSLEKFLAVVECGDIMTAQCPSPASSCDQMSTAGSPAPHSPSEVSVTSDEGSCCSSLDEVEGQQLSSSQLSSLMNAVMDIIVQTADPPNPADLTGGFMVIPDSQMDVPDVLSQHNACYPAQVPDVQTTGSLPPLDQEDVLNELYQLEDAVNSTPSYGESNLPTVITDETL